MQNVNRGLGQGLKNIGSTLTNTGAKISLMTAPLVAFGAAGLNVASKFDSAMAEISARTGVVGEDLDAVRQFALQMGADTAFSAQEAADGLLELMSSGQNVEQAMATLPLVMDAAAASGEGLGQTADVLTNIMAAFGLNIESVPSELQAMAENLGVTDQMLIDWGNNINDGTQELLNMSDATGLTIDELYQMFIATEDAATVVQSLSAAASSSSADMASLGQGFANLGPVASQFGLSVDQTAAALAILAENGIQGAEAGTQLKSMLLNMSRDTNEVTAAWNTLGTSLYDADGNARDMGLVLYELKTALADLPVEEQNRLMKDLAGSYGIVGLQALLGDISIAGMQESMSEQALAADVAAARMDTFAGRMDSLKGSVETLMITAMTPFMNNVLKPLAEQMTTVINRVVDWANANPDLAGKTVMVVAAVAGLGAALIPLGMAFNAAGTAVAGLGTMLGLLMSPIGIALAAGAALTAAYVTNFGGFKDFIDNQVRPRLEDFFEFLGQVWISLQPTIESLRQGIEQAFYYIKDTIIPALQLGWQQFIDWVNTFWVTIQPTISEVKTGIETAFNFLKDTVIPALLEGFGTIVDFAVAFWGYIQPGIDAAKTGIELVFSNLQNTIIPALIEGFGTFVDFVVDLWNAISPGIDAVKTGTESAFNFIKDSVIDPVRIKLGDFVDRVNTVWGDIQQGIDALKTNLEGAFSAMAGVVQPVIDAIGGIVGAVSEAAAAISSLPNPASTIGGLGDQVGQLAGAAASDPGKFIGALGNALGFASGTSWTGSGSTNQVAGVTHMREAVIPAGGMQVIPSPRGVMIEGTLIASGGSGAGGGGIAIYGPMYFEGVGDINDLYDALERIRRQRA